MDSAYWSNCNIEHLRLAYKDALDNVSNDYNDFAPKCLLFNNNGIINDVSFSNFKINLQRDKYIDNLIIRNVSFSIGNERKLNYDPAIDFNVILLGPCGDNIIIENAGYVPSYTRKDITDDLHQLFGYRTDYQIMQKSKIRNIIKKSKNDKILL